MTKPDVIMVADYSDLEQRIMLWTLEGKSNLEIGTLAHQFLLDHQVPNQPDARINGFDYEIKSEIPKSLEQYAMYALGSMEVPVPKQPEVIRDKPHRSLPRHRRGNFKRRQRRG